jgi:SP family arabinose:H+ symporter-like MFS transporter
MASHRRASQRRTVISTVKVQTSPASATARYNTFYIWAVSCAGALGGLLFGYDWVVIGGAKPFYEKFFHLSQPSLQGWAMSCALVGCLIGALVSGELSDHYGRKRLLMLAAIVFGVSSVKTGMAGSLSQFVVWRILGGFGIGLASNLSPMYIAEIAPAQQRGKLVSINQLAIVSGILLAQIVNWWIAKPMPANATFDQILFSWNGQAGWRWMFGVTAIPSLLFFVATLLVPESPRWLIQKGRIEQARAILSRVGGDAYADRIVDEIVATIKAETAEVNVATLLEPRIRKVLLLGIGLAVLQQWCGINVIFNYAEEVFAAAGYQVSSILFNIVVTGVVNLVFTFVALFSVDRFGRRALMLTGAGGLAVIYTVLGVLYRIHSHGAHMLLLVVAAIACYAMSLAPVTWVIISEIFPNKIRGTAMSVAVTALWIACFILTYSFPLLNSALGAAGTFWIYAAICLVGLLYLSTRLPETKGKSLEEIEQSWN